MRKIILPESDIKRLKEGVNYIFLKNAKDTHTNSQFIKETERVNF